MPGISGTPGSLSRDGFKGEKGSIRKRDSQGAIGIPWKIGPRGPEGCKGVVGKKGEIGKVGAKGSADIPGNSGSRGLKGFKGNKGSMGTKESTGIPGSSGPRGSEGFKGENGIGTKGEKGNAADMDPRERKLIGNSAHGDRKLIPTTVKYKVSGRIRVFETSGLIKLAVFVEVNSNDS